MPIIRADHVVGPGDWRTACLEGGIVGSI